MNVNKDWNKCGYIGSNLKDRLNKNISSNAYKEYICDIINKRIKFIVRRNGI